MKVFGRMVGESIVINENIYLTIIRINGNVVDVVVDAPSKVLVDTFKAHQKIQLQKGAQNESIQ